MARAIADGELGARAHVGPGAPELQQLATGFNTMADKVQWAMERERRFVANASHHLGNLLTPLRIRVESLRLAPDENGVELRSELDRLEAVVARLMELNRAEEIDQEPQVVDVSATVDEALALWRAVGDGLGIELRREGRERASYAWSIPGAIEEAIDNLLDNSAKYAPGSVVTVKVVQGLENVRVVVSDHGPGMSEDDIAQAHSRFWRGSGHQNQPGSGLGLAILDALAERCGGRLELRNAVGGGLEASFVLRRAHEPLEPLEPAEPLEPERFSDVR
ncbi:MAG: HAMP domain-containing sensor histidine kinase [Ilumatobacteraceae bacterium]